MNRTGQTDKLAEVLEMTECPESYSDEQLLQLLSDEQRSDYYRLMCDATSAYAGTTAESEIDIDAEWERFSQTHFAAQTVTLSIWRKIAAVFIGMMMISGLSYAAIHIFNKYTNETPVAEVAQPVVPAEVIKAQPEEAAAPAEMVYTFENAELEEILTEVANYYKLRAEFRNDEARHVRLYIKWNKEEEAQTLIKRLNRFEKVNVTLTNGHIIAE